MKTPIEAIHLGNSWEQASNINLENLQQSYVFKVNIGHVCFTES